MSIFKTLWFQGAMRCLKFMSLKGFATDQSEPWSDTAPPVWGRWICRSCWVQWWWQSCCPQRCSYCSTQAAVQPFAPEWGGDPAWWPECLWTLGALADTAEKKATIVNYSVWWYFVYIVTLVYFHEIMHSSTAILNEYLPFSLQTSIASHRDSVVTRNTGLWCDLNSIIMNGWLVNEEVFQNTIQNGFLREVCAVVTAS